MKIENEELQLVFAHALTVGMAMNPQMLSGSVESRDIGRMLHDRAAGIAAGYKEAAEDNE